MTMNDIQITSRQIRALRAEAVKAGDIAGIRRCSTRMASPTTRAAATAMPIFAEIREALRMTQDEALAECARVIAETAP